MVSHEALEAAAERGDPAAQLRLAERLAGVGRGDAAVVWLARAARTGHAESFALFGAWQLLGYNIERNVDEGVERLAIAARHGEDRAAAFLANAFASGLTGNVDWVRAVSWLIESGRLGNARALVQVALLQADGARSVHRTALLTAAAAAGFDAALEMMPAGEQCPPPADPGGLPWPELQAGIDVASLLSSIPQPDSRLQSPWIATYRNVADADTCRYVIAIGEPRLEPAAVNVPGLGRSMNAMRTNRFMTIGPTYGDVLIQILSERIARLTDTPVAWQEDSNVLCYRPGEAYEEHFDFFDPQAADFRDEIAERGQRVATALIYLNSGYEGGATEFPRLGWMYRGHAGDVIAWRNVAPDGTPDARTLHAGRPPTSGEKWILSKWIRGRRRSN